MNRLTGSDLGSENELFTSLSPYVRSKRLPSGVKVASRHPNARSDVFPAQALFLDTVGFVSNLPHALFSAFKATLQQVQAAHLIVHVCFAPAVSVAEALLLTGDWLLQVCDVSNSETEFLKANVMKVHTRLAARQFSTHTY